MYINKNMQNKMYKYKINNYGQHFNLRSNLQKKIQKYKHRYIT